MGSIVKSIYEHSLNYPLKTAIIATDFTVNYATLWNLIIAMTTILKNNGVKKGDRVLLEADHTVEYLVCCYGIHLSGAIHVPVEHGIPEERVIEISNEIKPVLTLIGDNPIKNFDMSLMELLNIEYEQHDFPDEKMIQEILFTTGTTGKSKGVMISHEKQMNMCKSQNSVLDYSKDNVWLIPSPMNHAAGLRKTHMSMVNGSTVLLMRGFTNLKLFFESIKKYEVTSIYLPPAGVHYVLMLAPNELAKYNNQLDFLYSSSSALPGGDKEKLIDLLPNVRKFDAYGSSEVGAVCYIDYNNVRGNSKCVGTPNPGVEISIVDSDYNPIISSPNNPGIIAIKSNTVTEGYWNEPELTAQTIINGTIYMSDLGYIDDGYLYLVGRRDDVINVGGFKVAPTEVEDVASGYPSISECVCVPYDDKITGRNVKLLVVLNKGYSLEKEKIVQYLEKKLEAYKVPKFIDSVSEIAKTYNGKIDRKKIIMEQSKL